MSALTAPALQRFVVATVALMFVAHIVALFMSGASAMSTPISQLSRGNAAWLHTSGLCVLAAGWVALAMLLARCGDGSLFWRIGCGLAALNAALMLFVAAYFLLANDVRLFGPNANDPLAVLASNVGVVMGMLQFGLRRMAPKVAWLNLLIFVIWMALVPVIPFIDASWLGAYERTVGSIMLLWMGLLALAAPRFPRTATKTASAQSAPTSATQ